MKRLTKEANNGMLAWYTKNDSGLPEYVAKSNPYREICEKLKAYEDLEEQGLLLRLPCKVGDEFYMFDSDCLEWNEYKIVQVKCIDMFIDLWEKVDSRVFFKDYNGRKHHCLFAEFSKNVFLTKEKAESTLEKMKGEEHE